MTAALEAAAPHVIAALLHGLRLLPAAISSPLLGGPLVPPVVRIALAFGLGAFAHLAAGGGPASVAGLELAAAAARELALGTVFGVVAALPFEAARAGGRLTDTLRGATLVELHVAPLRQRETATGDLLVQWTLVLAASAGGDRLIVAALLRSFEVTPVGSGFASAHALELVLRAGAELLACAFCVGAPAAAGVLAADLAISAALRAAPQLQLGTVAQPARAALGLAAIGVSAAAVAGRLTELVALSAALLRSTGVPS